MGTVLGLAIGIACADRGSSGDIVTALTVTRSPTRTAYTVGESFDPTGMVVTAIYQVRTPAAVMGYTWTPSGELAETDTSVTISYTENGYTVTATVPITVAGSKVYGVKWYYGSSSTYLTRLTPSSDPNGYVTETISGSPSPAVGAVSGSSPFDALYPWSGMDEYNIVGGIVLYRKGDTGFSRTDYDTMVYIPAFYYKVTDDSENENRYLYISTVARTGFAKHPGSGRYVGRYTTISGYCSKSGAAPLVNITRAAARTGSRAKGTKWQSYDIAAWSAIRLLYLVEFADWNCQLLIGKGITDVSAPKNSGGTDIMVYHTGRAEGTSDEVAAQYRHIENLWGNVWQWVDGINLYDRAAYVCTDPQYYADDTTTGYTATGVTVPSTDGYITKIGYSAAAEFALLPTESGGSDSTYVTDRTWSDTGWRTFNAGGRWTNLNAAGLFCEDCSKEASFTGEGVGSRLMYIP